MMVRSNTEKVTKPHWLASTPGSPSTPPKSHSVTDGSSDNADLSPPASIITYHKHVRGAQ